MAPKKGQKMSLNEFLSDSALGSWADEMDALPSAPAMRTDEASFRSGDRYTRRGDDFTPRSERSAPFEREDLPLPTHPPYTAYVGNLAFDLTEKDLEEFFGFPKTKSIKIIRDKEDKPKGFGYLEFEELDDLKNALTKNGASLSGRTIRVNVAVPPKERTFGGVMDDTSKFDSPWRRDGPLPDAPELRNGSRRRYDGADRAQPAISDNASDWRSNRPRQASSDHESSSSRRRGSGFWTPDTHGGAADKDEAWQIGSKFKPSNVPPTEGPSRVSNLRGISKEQSSVDEGDWRAARPRSAANSSPSNSAPSTPQMARKKLELLPRSGNASASPSPLSSPKMSSMSASSTRPSPFGAAKPVDVSSREKEISDRLEKGHERSRERVGHSMSRTSSRTASDRNASTKTPSPGATPALISSMDVASSANVRPSLSFASAAAPKHGSKDIDRHSDDAHKAAGVD